MSTVPTINYTDRDFESIRTALVNRVRAEFPNTWRDFTESNIGMAWLELVAYVFDVLSFYTDEMVRNQFLATASDREAVILITQLVGYKMRPATSATVIVEATLPALEAVDIVIQKGTVIETANGVTFEVLQDQQIVAGLLADDITFAEGETQQDSFVSDGTAFQEFKLSLAPVIDGSVTVTVDGFTWTEVASLVFSDAASDNFSMRVDVEDFAYIKFGDGTSGAIPAANANIVVTYRVGGGVQGNIAIGEISGLTVQGLREGSAPEEFVQVSLENKERGSGGEDRETIESARFWAPRTVATNGRAVTEQDFDTLASQFNDPVYGAPAYAKARLKQRIPELNTVEIFLWARDGYGNIVAPSTNLKNAVQSYFDSNGAGAVRIITVDTEVKDGNNVVVDVDVLVTGDGTVADSELTLAVTQSIRSYFSLPDNQPGTDIRLSRLYNLIQTTEGVSYALIRRVTASEITSEVIGTSDGVTQMWTWTTFEQPLAGTIQITAGSHSITDDGNGNLIGDVDDAFANSVDYDSGAISFGFKTPVPASGAGITIQYRYPLEYQRSETRLHQGNGVTTRFRGQLATFPVIPNSVAFTDGFQTTQDDGTGNLIGSDLNANGVNTIDYDTGTYDFTFQSAPSETRWIAALYKQLLSVNAGDVPIDEDQLAISGFVDVEIQTGDSGG